MKVHINFYNFSGFLIFSKETEVNTIQELQDFIELQEDIKREDFMIDFYEVKDYAET